MNKKTFKSHHAEAVSKLMTASGGYAKAVNFFGDYMRFLYPKTNIDHIIIKISKMNQSELDMHYLMYKWEKSLDNKGDAW
jgi:hypothetical protein